MDDKQAVFRQVAIERLASPEQLDQLLQVTRVQGWLVLAVVALLLGAALGWGYFGHLPSLVEGQGVLLRAGGITDLPADRNGVIGAVRVRPGDLLEPGDLTVAIHGPAGSEPEGRGAGVFAPFPLRVVEVLVRRGQPVTSGTAVLSVEAIQEELVAALFVSTAMGPRIRPGMAVRLSPIAGGDRQDSFQGRVARVIQYPATPRGLNALFADPVLADRLLQRDLRIRVDVVLEEQPAERLPLLSGREVHGRILVSRQRPLAKVLPWLGGQEEG